MSNKITSHLSAETGKKVSNTSFLNTVLKKTNDTYGTQIPLIKPHLTINHANLPMEMIQANANEIYKTLVNRIGTVVGKALSFKNPLGIFKTDSFNFGDTMEEYFVTMAEPENYNGKSNDHPHKFYDTDIKTFYHSRLREHKFARTIEKYWTNKAFISEYAFDDFIDKMVLGLLSSDELKEYEAVKGLVTLSLSPVNFEGGTIRTPHSFVDTSSDGWVEAFNMELMQRSNYFTVPNTARFENAVGVPNVTPIEEQYLIVDVKHAAYLDTLLANTFDKKKISPLFRKIVVDEFPTYTGSDDLNGAKPFCALVSKDTIILKDKFFEMTGAYDEGNIRYNLFLHHHQLVSYSLFENAHIYLEK